MKKTMSIVGILVSTGMMLPGTVGGQAKHTPTIEESISLKGVGSAKISPDGKFVAYEIRETNWKDNEFVQQLWLVNVETGKSFQLS